MEYDFSGLCADQLFKLKKRLESMNKAFIKEYEMALNVINKKEEYDHRGETIVFCQDNLSDLVRSCETCYMQTMNKIQDQLGKHL
jgi:regulator of RNase E activity RraB